MEQSNKDKIKFCAFCPDPCRNMFAVNTMPKESYMCSAFSYLAHSCLSGFVEYTSEIDEHLKKAEIAKSASSACPYGYKVHELIEEARQELNRK